MVILSQRLRVVISFSVIRRRKIPNLKSAMCLWVDDGAWPKYEIQILLTSKQIVWQSTQKNWNEFLTMLTKIEFQVDAECYP